MKTILSLLFSICSVFLSTATFAETSIPNRYYSGWVYYPGGERSQTTNVELLIQSESETQSQFAVLFAANRSNAGIYKIEPIDDQTLALSPITKSKSAQITLSDDAKFTLVKAANDSGRWTLIPQSGVFKAELEMRGNNTLQWIPIGETATTFQGKDESFLKLSNTAMTGSFWFKGQFEAQRFNVTQISKYLGALRKQTVDLSLPSGFRVESSVELFAIRLNDVGTFRDRQYVYLISAEPSTSGVSPTLAFKEKLK